MIRRLLFLCAFVPIALALLAANSLAMPMTARIGAAHATIVMSPDPPQVGTNLVTVTIAGVSPAALARTTVRYTTLMPSMNMIGPSGAAARVPGRTNKWHFKIPFGTAAHWRLRVQFSGGVTGALNAILVVGQVARISAVKPAEAMTNRSIAVPRSGMPTTPSDSMVGMNASSAGDASVWRNATFALLVVMFIGALAVLRNRRPATIALVAIAGLTVLAIAFAQSRSSSPSAGMASMQGAQGSAPVPVTLATVAVGSSGMTISAPANVQPYLVQEIVARAPGLLTDFRTYTGDRLRAGEIVAHLSEPELQDSARAAQSAAQAALDRQASVKYDASARQAAAVAKQQQLAYWKAEIAREKSLLDQGAVSVQGYQNERAQASAAQSAYDAARAQLAGANASIQAARALAAEAASNAQAQSVMAGYTNVIVPDDSIVMKRLIDPGVYVQPGTPILQVAVVNRLRVQAQVAQQDIAGVRIGTPIDITFADGKVVHGRISSLSPVLDPNTHTAIAEAIVPNPGDRYQPGAFVHAILHAQGTAPRHSFAVPSGSVVGGVTTAIWTDVNGAAHRVPVTVISNDGTTARVTGSLQAGMRVVVTGAENLEEGQAIAESGS